jgi:hypothetical protein
MFTIRAIKACPPAPMLRSFDVELRVQWLEAKLKIRNHRKPTTKDQPS